MTCFRLSCLVAALLTLTAPAQAFDVAPVPYWIPNGPFGFGGSTTLSGADDQTTFTGTVDQDGFRKGLSVRSYSYPVNAFTSGFAMTNGFALNGFTGLGSAGLASDGAQYGYSFRGIGDTAVTLIGGVTSLRVTPDVFTSIVTPGFDNGRTLATGIQAGIEFKPTSNLSLSLSATMVQPSQNLDTDLRSQLISGARR
jgi:hypothetical protein